MKYCKLNRWLSIYCLLVGGFHSSYVFATDWYSNDPQLNQKQGFGDFPPATIEQDLDRQKLKVESRPLDYEPPQYRDTNPWDGGYAPVDHSPRQYSGSDTQRGNKQSSGNENQQQGAAVNREESYPPANPSAGYGNYYPNNDVRSYGNNGMGYGSPWNYPGSGAYGPWNNRGSSFSPWGGSGWPGGGSSPFGMSGPGNWFD